MNKCTGEGNKIWEGKMITRLFDFFFFFLSITENIKIEKKKKGKSNEKSTTIQQTMFRICRREKLGQFEFSRFAGNPGKARGFTDFNCLF